MVFSKPSTDVAGPRVVPRSQRAAKTASVKKTTFYCFSLLCFFVGRVLPAAITELRELKPPSGGLFVLRGRVIALFARRTLQGNNFTHTLS
jgi:hypothetical protein